SSDVCSSDLPIQVAYHGTIDFKRTAAEARSFIEHGASGPAAGRVSNGWRRRRVPGRWRRVPGRWRRVSADFASRGDAIVELASQSSVLTGLQANAIPAEARIGANFPYTIADDNGFGPVVEIGAIQIGHVVANDHASALEIGALEEDDLARQYGKGDECHSCTHDDLER